MGRRTHAPESTGSTIEWLNAGLPAVAAKKADQPLKATASWNIDGTT
jgi:hypothetical protein